MFVGWSKARCFLWPAAGHSPRCPKQKREQFWLLGPRPKPAWSNRSPTSTCPSPASAPTSLASVERESLQAAAAACKGKFSKLSWCLFCPPSHPPASSEAPRSSGEPLPDQPLLERSLLPGPSFPGVRDRPVPPDGQLHALGQPGELGEGCFGPGGCSLRPAVLVPRLPPHSGFWLSLA